MDESSHRKALPGDLLSADSAAFVEELYESYLADPSSVSGEWYGYFEELRGGRSETPHGPLRQQFLELGRERLTRGAAPASVPDAARSPGSSAAQQVASALVSAYRVYGHLSAHKNPLTLRPAPPVPELTPGYYGLSEQDLSQPVREGPFQGSLREVMGQLEESYCGSIGFEFSYLPIGEREWFQERIEAAQGRPRYSEGQRRRILSKLNAAEGLER
ncbi:MAG: 2-oxoglutarate dehydrogenase E1 subunit family protein, partial [Deinococcus sp.]